MWRQHFNHDLDSFSGTSQVLGWEEGSLGLAARGEMDPTGEWIANLKKQIKTLESQTRADNTARGRGERDSRTQSSSWKWSPS